MDFLHKSVLLDEVLEIAKNNFNLGDSISILDGTLGEAGHTVALKKLFTNSSLDALDCDSDMILRAKEKLSLNSVSVEIFNEYFDNYLKTCQKKYDIILLDLGVSMYHFTQSEKGLSYNKTQDLDMRLGTEGICAYDVVNYYSEKEIADILYEYGEETNSKNIAKNIIKRRKEEKIKTTTELEEVVYLSFFNRKPNQNYTAKTFMALRIYANSELERLKNAISFGVDKLNNNGIIMIISFHSLEDRIVKQAFREFNSNFGYEILKKPITPSAKELNENKASRSSKLRYLKKI